MERGLDFVPVSGIILRLQHLKRNCDCCHHNNMAAAATGVVNHLRQNRKILSKTRKSVRLPLLSAIAAASWLCSGYDQQTSKLPTCTAAMHATSPVLLAQVDIYTQNRSKIALLPGAL